MKNWLSSFAARWHWQPAETASRKSQWKTDDCPCCLRTWRLRRSKDTNRQYQDFVSQSIRGPQSRSGIDAGCGTQGSTRDSGLFWTVLSRQSKQRLTPSKASTPWRKMPNISKWVTTYGLHKPSRRISIVPSFASKWASRELWAWLPFIAEPAISIM